MFLFQCSSKAERAGLSAKAVSDLERDPERLPRLETVRLLAEALRLAPEQRAPLLAAARPDPAPAPTPPAISPHPSALRLLPRPLTPLIGRDADVAAVAARRTSGAARLLTDVPALPADQARALHNLPLPVTSFIGREQELAAVTRLLGTTRLLTLTGTGGTGKTRLALEAAAAVHAGYPAGVWLAELAPFSDPAGVPRAVAGAVGLQEEAGQPLLATLVAALRQRRLLLVLDNCEHLLEACAALAGALVRACPEVRILATSREALGLAGETAWRVPSLALPDTGPLPPPEEVGQVAAVRLFVERARAVQPDFALGAHNAETVVQICRRLDGIPLAIELAAARLRGLSVAHLAARLDQRFRLLTGGSRGALPRQQTLQATVEWSYDLLNAPEQSLFNRLSVFAGGFTLEAAEAVCAGGVVAAEDVLDLLLRLVDKSLVIAEASGGNVERYRLLETLRHFGRERLLAAGEAAEVYARHLTYLCALAEEAFRHRFYSPGGDHPVVWVDVLESEHMNIRQALQWALDAGAVQDGLRLAGTLWWYWRNGGFVSEGQQWLTALLAVPAAASRTPARAWALYSLAHTRRHARVLVGAQAVGAQTQAWAAEAVALAREAGDTLLLAWALHLLGRVVAGSDYPAGQALMEESTVLCRELGLTIGVLSNLGVE